MPTQTVPYSLWSSSRIRTPPPSTNNAVAATITLAAIRIDGGSRRNFDIRRSNGFGGVACSRCTRSATRESALRAGVTAVQRGVEDGRDDHDPAHKKEAEQQCRRDPERPVGARPRRDHPPEDQHVEQDDTGRAHAVEERAGHELLPTSVCVRYV